MLGLPPEQLALAMAALSLFVSLFTYFGSSKSISHDATATEVKNFLEIVRDIERFAEDIVSADNDEIMKIRLSCYANYMETLSLLVNRRRFTPLLRDQVTRLIINFVYVFRKNEILEQIFADAIKLNPTSYQELKKLEKRHKKRIDGLLAR